MTQPLQDLRTILTPPADPVVVTLAELKAHLRLTHDDDDDLLQHLEQAAVEMAENYTRRTFLQTSMSRTLHTFPVGRLPVYLYRPELVSVDDVSYADSAGDPQTLTGLQIGHTGKQPWIVPAIGEVWPATQTDNVDAVVIQYTAGWATRSAVPSAVRLAVRQLVAHYYEHAEPMLEGTTAQELPFQVKALLARWRVWEVR